MKKRYIFSLLILIVLGIGACNKNRVIYSKVEETKSKKQLVDQDSSWHLKYRIPECDSALVFMDQVIVPIKSEPKNELDKLLLREVFIRISGEDHFELSKNEKYKFYVNPDCFIGKSSIEVLKIFCKQEVLYLYETIDKNFQEQNRYWILSVSGLGKHTYIRFSKGKVVKVSYDETDSSH